MSADKGLDRLGIIEAIKTPLGFFSLIVLVIESGFSGLALAATGSDRSFLLYAIVGVLVLLVIVVSVISVIKPEALWGKRYSALEEFFAEALGKDIFTAFDGYLSNDLVSREEAYEQLQEITASSRYSQSRETAKFTDVFVRTLVNRAAVTGKRQHIKGVLATGNKQK
jgi:hypothetical protein